MSDGIKDWHDDMEDQDHKLRHQHLESLGIAKISVAIKDLSSILNRFDSDSLMLSRSEWAQLDDIKKIVKGLQPK